MKTKLTSAEIKSFGKKLENIFAGYGHFGDIVDSYDFGDDSIVFKMRFTDTEKTHNLLVEKQDGIKSSAGSKEINFRIQNGLIEIKFPRPVVKLNS